MIFAANAGTTEERLRSSRSPFLLAFAEQPAVVDLEGVFDEADDVWMVTVDGQAEPLILQHGTLASTQTVTRVMNEGTDED